jgi:hypothetical protein
MSEIAVSENVPVKQGPLMHTILAPKKDWPKTLMGLLIGVCELVRDEYGFWATCGFSAE